MKQADNKVRVLFSFLIPLLLILSCSEVDERNNPFDPGSSNWKPPVLSLICDSLSKINDTLTLRVTQEDSSVEINHYLWIISGEDDTLKTYPEDPDLKYTWADSGKKTVELWAFNTDDVKSLKAEICTVDVRQYAPYITARAVDSSIDINDSVWIKVSAKDTVGKIKGFSWETDGKTFVYKKYIPESDTAETDTTDTDSTGTDSTGTDSTGTDSTGIETTRSETITTPPPPIYTYDSTYIHDSIRVAFSDSGIHTVLVRCVDDDNAWSVTCSIPVTVTRTDPIISAQPDTTVDIKDSIWLNAEAEDNDDVTYHWRLDGKNFVEDSSSIKTAFYTEGIHYVLVKSVDNDNIVSNIDTIIVTVNEDTPILTVSEKYIETNINDSVQLSATAVDDGTISYFWAINTRIYRLGDSSKKIAFPDAGTYTVLVKCSDEDGLVSNIDTVIVDVSEGRPLLTPQSDTTVSETDILKINLEAEDSNEGGSIVAYHWDSDGNGSCDASGQQIEIEKPGGGTQRVIWGAKDDDGLFVKDSFTIVFNSVPDTVYLSVSNDFRNFTNYDSEKNTGDFQLLINSSERDSSDIHTYALFIGTDQDNIVQEVPTDTAVRVFTGEKGVYNMVDTTLIELTPDTEYFCRLKVKDIHGDSAVTESSFRTPRTTAMAFIPAKDSSFQMGSTFNTNDTSETSEMPVHSVSFTYDFWMDTTEVTRKKYKRLMTKYYPGSVFTYNSSFWPSQERYPVDANWYEAVLYCNALSKELGKDTVYSYDSVSTNRDNEIFNLTTDYSKNGHRLPTEAEWEYACRAGTDTESYWTDFYGTASCAKFGSNLDTVAQLQPNIFGLYDMNGNISEWCNDWCSKYKPSDQVNPRGVKSASEKVIRGGNYRLTESEMRSAYRQKNLPTASPRYTIGFRTVSYIQ